MKKFGKFLAMAIMVVLVSGAQSFAADSVMSTVLGPGWQCLLIPTSFYQPGTIFSIDNATGEKSRIISLKVPIQKGPAAFPKVTDTKKLSGDMTVSLLEKLIPGLGAKLKAEGSQLNEVGAEYKDVREETTFETEVNEIVEKWLRGYDGLKDTHRYFLVRDAYLAGHMNYIFTKRDIEDLGGEAKFKRLFVVKGTVAHHQHENRYQLDQE